ncbi:hypothetical protein AAHE18_14G052400 [Arachis hypogaea]
MMMRTNCVIIVLFLFFAHLYSSFSLRESAPSLRLLAEIYNYSSKTENLAKFAIAEHNKRSKHNLLRLIQILSVAKVFHTKNSVTYSLEFLAKDRDGSHLSIKLDKLTSATS